MKESGIQVRPLMIREFWEVKKEIKKHSRLKELYEQNFPEHYDLKRY